MSSSQVRQVLLTPFNHRLSRSYPAALDEDWLRFRWDLFEKVTLPSIAGQTNADFDWLIRFHRASPAWLLERAAALDLPCRVRPLVGEVDGTVATDLEDLRATSLEALLVTRVDSDDALHRRAMATIRASYEPGPASAEAFTFQVGYRLDLATARLGLLFHYSPPFCTFVQRPPSINPLDAGGDHWTLPRRHRLRPIADGDPMFVQTIHGRNLRNELGQRVALVDEAVSAHILQTAFNIDAERLLGICRTVPLERVLRSLGPRESSPDRA